MKLIFVLRFFNKAYFWTSGSDKQLEGKWIWESTGLNLYPGYANWADTQPDNAEDNEDCMYINLNRNGRIGWNDFACSGLFDAICENHA
jgi:C-type lectin domain family 10 protein A